MRKSRIRALVLTLLIFSLFSVTVFAEQAVVTGSGVNIRSGPGTSFGIIDTVPCDTLVEVTERTNASWYQVRWDGNVGYISTAYLRIVADSSGTEPDSSQATVVIVGDGTTITVTPTPTPTAVIVNSPAPTASPAPSYTITALPSPTPTPQPSSAPAGGYVLTPLPSASPSPAPTEAPVVIVGPNGTTIVTPTPSPSPSPTPAVQSGGNASQSGKAGQITGNAVRLRTGPGTGYSIIETYNKGTALSIHGVSGEWTLVTINGVSGYVYSSYVQESTAPTATPAVEEAPPAQMTLGLSEPSGGTATATLTPESRDAFVSGSSVRMREGPSMTANIIAELSYGTALRITGTSGEWYRVICNGRDGFVHSSYVKIGSYTPQASVSTSSGAQLGKEIANYALGFVGYKYSWGGKSPATGFDCAGFVQYIFSQFGYETSRVANDVLKDGVHVDPKDLQPGDVLCFWSGSGYCGHVGIYIGNNRFVHAANSATGVVTTSLTEGYYATRGYEIRRII